MSESEWDGRGHQPGYLKWAWESASPSLRGVALQLSQKEGDNLVYKAFMTSGRRAILRADVILAVYARERFEADIKSLIDRLADSTERLDVATGPVTLPDGEVGMQLEGKLYAIKKAKPWDQMTEAEQRAYVKSATSFIMGDD